MSVKHLLSQRQAGIACFDQRKRGRSHGLKTLGLLGAMGLMGQAHGLSYVSDSGDLSLNVDTTVSYGALFRIEEANDLYSGTSVLSAQNNKNDGNNNWDRGMVSSVIKATTELDLVFKDNYGMFLRANAFYDQFIMDDGHDFDGDIYQRNNHFRTAGDNSFSDDVKDLAGSDVRFLDAYVWGDFFIGDIPVNIRLGDQVVSWGEALFLQDGVNSANPADLSKLRLPGSELREALTPVGMLYLQVGITDNMSVEAFYQYDWENSEPDASGTFFATTDALGGEGNNEVIVDFTGTQLDAALPTSTTGLSLLDLYQLNNGITDFSNNILVNERFDVKEPDDSGQYGIAFRYFASELNDTEFAFYYMNYHSRKPVAQLRTGQADGAFTDGTVACAATQALLSISSCDPVTVGTSLAGLGSAGTAFGAAIAGLNVLHYIDTSGYGLLYPEDVEVFGFSFNTTIGDTSLAGELAFRPDAPILPEFGDNILGNNVIAGASSSLGIGPITAQLLNPGLPMDMQLSDSPTHNFGAHLGTVGANTVVDNIAELDILNGSLVTIHNFGPALNTDRLVGVLELGFSYADGMDEDLLYASDASILMVTQGAREDGFRLLGEGSSSDYMDEFSWGYRVVLSALYNDAFAGVNFKPAIRFAHDVSGNSYLTGNFVAGRRSVTLALDTEYRNQWQVGVGFTWFGGARRNNQLYDRDNASVTVKYSF